MQQTVSPVETKKESTEPYTRRYIHRAIRGGGMKKEGCKKRLDSNLCQVFGGGVRGKMHPLAGSNQGYLTHCQRGQQADVCR